MDFYDIVSETCAFDDGFRERLGFKNIFTVNKDVMAVGAGRGPSADIGVCIAFGRPQNLLPLVKGGVGSVAITDSYIDKELMEAISENGCILCMPMVSITSSYGQERVRNIYKMSKLFSHARKLGIEVSFASMAKTALYMNSYIQLIALARLVGADDGYARHSISELNRRVGSGMA